MWTPVSGSALEACICTEVKGKYLVAGRPVPNEILGLKLGGPPPLDATFNSDTYCDRLSRLKRWSHLLATGLMVGDCNRKWAEDVKGPLPVGNGLAEARFASMAAIFC